MEDILYLMDHLRFGVFAEEVGGFVDIDFLAGALGIVFKKGFNGGSLARVGAAKDDKVFRKEKMGMWQVSYMIF
jgi:hypothetical protein